MELEIAVALVTVFMLAVTIISALSYSRTGSRKVLIVTCAFAVFFLKGVILSAGLLTQEAPAWERLTLASVMMDAVVALLLFAAMIVRKPDG